MEKCKNSENNANLAMTRFIEEARKYKNNIIQELLEGILVLILSSYQNGINTRIYAQFIAFLLDLNVPVSFVKMFVSDYRVSWL